MAIWFGCLLLDFDVWYVLPATEWTLRVCLLSVFAADRHPRTATLQQVGGHASFETYL